MNKLEFQNITPQILGQSQKGQDSLIQYTFLALGTSNNYYVEFGAGNGITDSNTFFLKEMLGCTGLLLDCAYENKDINLHKRKLTKDNIVEIFEEFKVPESFDFLSVDIDGNDFWLLQKILMKYKPRVIMVETNVRFSPETELVQRYDDNWFWQGAGWYGASPRAMARMASNFGYTAVHIHLDDMILVRTDELKKNGYAIPTWESIYPEPRISLYDSHRENIFNPKKRITPNLESFSAKEFIQKLGEIDKRFAVSEEDLTEALNRVAIAAKR